MVARVLLVLCAAQLWRAAVGVTLPSAVKPKIVHRQHGRAVEFRAKGQHQVRRTFLKQLPPEFMTAKAESDENVLVAFPSKDFGQDAEHAAESVFRIFDTDSDWRLSQDELLVAAKALGIFEGSNMEWPEEYKTMSYEFGFLAELGMGIGKFKSLIETTGTSEGLVEELSDAYNSAGEELVRNEITAAAAQVDTATGGSENDLDISVKDDIEVNGDDVERRAEAIFETLDVDSDKFLNKDELLVVAKRLGVFNGSDADWPNMYNSIRGSLEFTKAGMDLIAFEGFLSEASEDGLKHLLEYTAQVNEDAMAEQSATSPNDTASNRTDQKPESRNEDIPSNDIEKIRVGAVFTILDSDSDQRLNQDELHVVARAFEMLDNGTSIAWPLIYESMSEELNFSEAGMDLAGFENLVDLASSTEAGDTLHDQLLKILLSYGSEPDTRIEANYESKNDEPKVGPEESAERFANEQSTNNAAQEAGNDTTEAEIIQDGADEKNMSHAPQQFNGSQARDVVGCVADYGAQLNSTVCCGQEGLVQLVAHICTANVPICHGFVQGIFESHLGTCQASQASSIVPSASYKAFMENKRALAKQQ